MNEEALFRGAADAVLVLHVLLVCFVVGGLLAIWIGRALRWRWVDSRTYRIVHLATIVVVVAESWLDLTCPLTTWERMLRLRAHDASYDGSFVGHWLQRALYYDAPPWVFIAGYTAFGVAVVATWICLPPRRRVRS
jgi:hypothetical protein